jgi:DNA-binding HxlR family transcriptional regulator
MNRRRRFDELQAGLGIARNVLSARLQRLVDEDILERRAYQANPERYEYFLTEKGLDLWPALVALLHWGDRHSPVPNGPPMLIVHKECGGRVSDRGTCESCGQVLHARDAQALPGPGLETAPRETEAVAAR